AQKELRELVARTEVKQPGAASLMGDVLSAMGDNAGATEAYQRALKIVPSDPYVLRRLASLQTGEPRIQALSALFEVERSDAALGLDLVTTLVAAKQTDSALAKARLVRERFWNNPLVLMELIRVLSKNGQHTEALSVCERVLTLDPRQPDAIIAYGDEL